MGRVWLREIIVLINTRTRNKYFCARAACTFFRQIIAYRWHNSVYAKLPDPSPSDKGSGSRDTSRSRLGDVQLLGQPDAKGHLVLISRLHHRLYP